MKLLAPNASDGDILGFCGKWVELVAANRLDDAIDLLWVPADYSATQNWTPGTLRTYIENYGSWEPMLDGTKWHVTSMEEVDDGGRVGFTRRATIVRLKVDARAGSVDVALPLNGEWSDLTAQFEFRPLSGATAIALYDLHVL